MKYLVVCVFMAILLVCNILLLRINNKSTKEKETFLQEYTSCLTLRQHLIGLIKNDRLLELESNGVTLLKCTVLNMENQKKSLKELIHRPVLVFRFFDVNCIDCIVSEINRLQISCDYEVILIGNNQNSQVNREIKENTHYPLYFMSKLNIPVEKLEKPYMFMLDEDMECSNVFVPIMEVPELSEAYIDYLSNQFMKQ